MEGGDGYRGLDTSALDRGSGIGEDGGTQLCSKTDKIVFLCLIFEACMRVPFHDLFKSPTDAVNCYKITNSVP